MIFKHDWVTSTDLKTQQAANGKRWYITPDGRKYASMTTVLGHGEKPWLENWKTMLGPDKAAKESKRTAERGNAVHDMMEKFIMNEDAPTKGHDADHIRRFNQLKYLLKRVDNVRAMETPLYSHRLRLAGRVDLIAEYEGVLSVIDFKTSNNVKTDDMVQDYFLQCTGYALMFEEMYDIPIDQIVILMCVEKGMVPLVWKREIDDYVHPLVERINTYYAETGAPE